MLVYRKLLPTEVGDYRDHLIRLDRDDRYARFSGTVSDAAIARHCQHLDWPAALLLGVFDGGVLRAAAELRAATALWPDQAEIALSVERPYQSQGVGAGLLGRGLTIARNRGIRSVKMVCHLDNRRVMKLARRFQGKVVLEVDDFGGDVGLDFVLGRATQGTWLKEWIADSASAVTMALDQMQWVALRLETAAVPVLPAGHAD
ncbi:MAG: GNAT family N-acetyltransferase [Azospirillum sp.]|nr:GNAT family N-acetyltransferase [Azospirillum sp.]